MCPHDPKSKLQVLEYGSNTMASTNNIESTIAMVTFLNELKPSHFDSVSFVVQMLVQNYKCKAIIYIDPLNFGHVHIILCI